MRRRLTRTAVVLAVILSCSSLLIAQNIPDLVAFLHSSHSSYVDALSRGNMSQARLHWDQVRDAARKLVAKGLTEYAEFDRPMPGSNQSQDGSTESRQEAEPIPTPTPRVQEDAPVSINISEQLWAEAECFVPATIPIEVTQTGIAEERREITVTVRGHVVDEFGDPIMDAEVGVSSWTTSTGPAGDFARSVPAEGFEDVELVIDDVQLVGPCLKIDPRVVGMGSDHSAVSGVATFTNTCPKPLEVVIPKEKDLGFRIIDCTGGSSPAGSVSGIDREDDLLKMLIGPDGRCRVQATLYGNAIGTVNVKLPIETSEYLSLECRPELHLVGSVGTPLVVFPAQIEFDEIVAVGSHASASISLRNRSNDEEVVLSGVGIAGFFLGDFTYTPVSDDGARVEGNSLVLAPGGKLRGRVDFTPQGDGVRTGLLSFELGGSSVVPEIIVPLKGWATSTP